MGYCGVCKHSKFFTKMFNDEICKECYKNNNIKTINDLKSELNEEKTRLNEEIINLKKQVSETEIKLSTNLKELEVEKERLNEEIVDLKNQIEIKNRNKLVIDMPLLNKELDLFEEFNGKSFEVKNRSSSNADRYQKGNRILNLIDNYVVIDIETTGLSPQTDKIIEIAAIKITNNNVVDSFQKLIKPPNPVSDIISKLTGITNEMLSNADNIHNVLFEFRKFIGNETLIGHNANFDINFLYDNSVKHLGIPLCNDYFDTLYYARKLLPDYPNHRLQYIATQLNIEVTEAHRALNDCFTTHHCYQKLKMIGCNKLPKVETVSNNIINSFKGKTIVTTGEFKMLTRNNIKEIIINSGGRAVDTVSKNTNYLLLGGVVFNTKDNGKSSKHLKAEELISKGIDIKIIFEDEFYDMLKSEVMV